MSICNHDRQTRKEDIFMQKKNKEKEIQKQEPQKKVLNSEELEKVSGGRRGVHLGRVSRH